MPAPQDRDRLAIDEMLAAIAGLRATAEGRTAAQIEDDWMRARALERGFEIVSEASRRLSDAARMTEPDIPWRQIADIGNVLRHEYHRIATDLLVQTLRKDVPPLEAALHRLRGRLPPS